MKTERRHELQTNTLADSLAHGLDAARPYNRLIAGIVLAVVVLTGAYFYLSAQKKERLASGWDRYLSAQQETDLSDLAEHYGGTTAGMAARLQLADSRLSDGINGLVEDKQSARQLLSRAINGYESVLSETTDEILSQRALFGLARAHEASGKLDLARQNYRRLAAIDGSPYAGVAERRAAELDRPAVKTFYDWFNKYSAARPMEKEPGIPGLRPNFNKDALPDDVKLPSVIDGKGILGEGTSAKDATSSPDGSLLGPEKPRYEPTTPAPDSNSPPEDSESTKKPETPAKASDAPAKPPVAPAKPN